MTSFFNCCYLLVIVIYLQTHTHKCICFHTPHKAQMCTVKTFFPHCILSRPCCKRNAPQVDGRSRLAHPLYWNRWRRRGPFDFESCLFLSLEAKVAVNSQRGTVIVFLCVCVCAHLWDSVETELCRNKACVMCFSRTFLIHVSKFFSRVYLPRCTEKNKKCKELPHSFSHSNPCAKLVLTSFATGLYIRVMSSILFVCLFLPPRICLSLFLLTRETCSARICIVHLLIGRSRVCVCACAGSWPPFFFFVFWL